MNRILIDCQPDISVFVGILVSDSYFVFIIVAMYSGRQLINKCIIPVPTCVGYRLVGMIECIFLTRYSCKENE